MSEALQTDGRVVAVAPERAGAAVGAPLDRIGDKWQRYASLSTLLFVARS